jgi:glycosyltransferase involved in cell wall biosynthesis
MKIVYVHHHLRQGGVTRVITEQIEAVGDAHQVLAVTGEVPDEPTPFPVAVIPSIAYDRDRNDRLTPEGSARAMLDAVRDHWGGAADLYHVHNPTLGKNRGFLSVLKSLQARGAKLLLQIHDFAEDGRPGNYTGEPYPENCHYAVINSRDQRLLRLAGLELEGLHLIPDAVRTLQVEPPDGSEDLVLYPVRAIRRKNIGEALLLSLFLRERERIGITLEPTGAVDVRSYRSWMDFVRKEQLPVVFGLGMSVPFEQVLRRARCILTTSIKEGFGLVFLESWMMNRPLFGRLLPDICADFREKGVKLDDLYSRLSVPLSLFDRERFFRLWERCYRERLALYGLEVAEAEVQGYLDGIRAAGAADFGMLSEPLQRQVILKLKESPELRLEFAVLNPSVLTLAAHEQPEPPVARNRAVVSREFSAGRNRERLLQTYERVCAVTPLHAVRVDVLLRGFNRPGAGHLLLCDRTCDE